MDTLGAQFLNESESNLSDSKYVQYNAERKGIQDASSEERVASWLDTIEGIHTKHRGNEEVMDRIRRYYHDQYVIKEEDFPESYFTNQQRLARERGHGHIEVTDRMRKMGMEVVRKDQKQSLDIWINYFTSPDSDYLPTWAKYWAFNGMLKLGRYNKETQQFEPRMKDTVAPFVEINSEALGYTLSTLEKKYGKEYFDLTDKITERNTQLKKSEILENQKKILSLIDTQGANQTGKVVTVRDEELGRVINVKRRDIQKMREEVNTSESFDSEKIREEIKILTDQRSKVLESRGVPEDFSNIDSRSEDFGRLYAYAINEVTPVTQREKEIIEGQWVKYEQGSDHKKLYDSLQGHGTGWCTAGGEGMAKTHLLAGDFYVYYSNNLNGEPVNPRIAIRMSGKHKIEEIRGVEEGQEMDSYILGSDILEKKLKEFGTEGEEYKQKAEDMRRLTEIDKKVNDNTPLTKDDILFLYEFERDIEGFGHGRDPRIMEICLKRDIRGDFAYLADISNDGDDSAFVETLIDKGYHEGVAIHLYAFQDLNSSVANKLLDSGEGWAVAEYLSSFSGLDSNTANRLIDDGKAEHVARYLSSFSDLDSSVARNLINNREAWKVAENVDRFLDSEHVVIASNLIDSGNREALVKYLHKFSGLDHVETANRLIDRGEGDVVARYLDNFSGLDHVETANRLIDRGDGWIVLKYWDNFSGLNHASTANRLIDRGEGELVIRNLHNFSDLNHNDTANRLIDRGESRLVARHLNFFSGLDSNTANRLIDEGEAEYVAKYLSSFSGLDSSVANNLIRNYEGWVVAKNLNNFSGLDYVAIANSLIIDGDIKSAEYVAEHLGDFLGLDHVAIADKFIENGYGKPLAKHLGNFLGLDHVATANKLIDRGDGAVVAEYLNNFSGLDHVATANRLIDEGSGEFVAQYLGNFSGLDHVLIANKLIDSGDIESLAKYLGNFSGLDSSVAKRLLGNRKYWQVAHNLAAFTVLDREVLRILSITGYKEYVIYHLDKFPGLDHIAMADGLIKDGSGELVAKYLNNFIGLNHVEIANKLINHWQKRDRESVAKYLGNFSGLDSSIANTLIDSGYGLEVARNLSSFTNLDSTVLERLKEFQS